MAKQHATPSTSRDVSSAPLALSPEEKDRIRKQDRAFFDGLIEDVADMPRWQKLLFRQKVNNLVIDIYATEEVSAAGKKRSKPTDDDIKVVDFKLKKGPAVHESKPIVDCQSCIAQRYQQQQQQQQLAPPHHYHHEHQQQQQQHQMPQIRAVKLEQAQLFVQQQQQQQQQQQCQLRGQKPLEQQQPQQFAGVFNDSSCSEGQMISWPPLNLTADQSYAPAPHYVQATPTSNPSIGNNPAAVYVAASGYADVPNQQDVGKIVTRVPTVSLAYAAGTMYTGAASDSASTNNPAAATVPSHYVPVQGFYTTTVNNPSMTALRPMEAATNHSGTTAPLEDFKPSIRHPQIPQGGSAGNDRVIEID